MSDEPQGAAPSRLEVLLGDFNRHYPELQRILDAHEEAYRIYLEAMRAMQPTVWWITKHRRGEDTF